MAKTEIKLALVYRDMWQSAGKYVPRVDQLVRVAPAIVDMGCFHRVETNGGGFEQVNLLFGENPNTSVRQWTQAFNDAGIQTQMLERGLNGIRMSPVPADVRELMFKVKKLQGTDISRTFDGLNNPQNLALSFEYAKKGGMIAQGALSLTFSPLHTVDYYIDLADQYMDRGAEEICIKDMAGIGRPVSVGKIVAGIRKRHPSITIQYHGHSTPGFSIVSSLEAARAGADIVDVGMEPLSWGTGHADLLTVHAMLKDAGFSVADVNMSAYMEARKLSQEFIDDFLGYYINPQNRQMNSLLIGPGLPGGMMGSLMADLESNLKSINKYLTKNDKPNITQEDLLIKLFDEVEYVWPRMGYPPLVTPFSQYVKNVALFNVINLIKGKERWSIIDDNTWGMLLGKSGQLLGDLDPHLVKLAQEQGREFYTGNPQDLYPNQLDEYREKMKEKGWDTGQDDEELLEYAMHPRQYEDFKSGAAKERFLADLEQRKAKTETPSAQAPTTAAVASTTAASAHPRKYLIDVDGQSYRVSVSYDQQTEASTLEPREQTKTGTASQDESNLKVVSSPLEGKFYLTKDSSEKAIQVGDLVQKGDTIAYVESMKMVNAITSDEEGTVVEILKEHGQEIDEDEIILKLR